MRRPIACVARPTASPARPSGWPSSITTETGSPAIEREGRQLDDRRASLDRDWNALVGPLGLAAEARTPVELRAWLRRREDVLQLLEKRDEVRQNVEPLEQAFATQRAAVTLAMDEVGEPSTKSGIDLADMLDQAEAVIKRQDDLVQKRTKLETKLAAARTERDTARLSLQSAETALDGWQAEWASKMARIGLEPDAAPEQAEVFLTKIGELLEKLNDRRNHLSRIRGIERDAEQFAADVAALSARVAPDLIDRPAGDQARELPRRLRDAQADDQKRTTLTQQRQREEANLRAAETRREEARVCLERLCAEAGCTDFDQLPEAERRSQDRRPPRRRTAPPARSN